jgi:hypothetical protein
MMNEERLAELLDEALNRRARVDAESHSAHHAFIQTLIERENRKQQLWDAVLKQLVGWGVVAVVAYIGAWVVDQLTIDFFRGP